MPMRDGVERMVIRDEQLLNAITKARDGGAAALLALDAHAEELGVVLHRLLASADVLRARAATVRDQLASTVEERDALGDHLGELEAMADRLAEKHRQSHDIYETAMTAFFDELNDGDPSR